MITSQNSFLAQNRRDVASGIASATHLRTSASVRELPPLQIGLKPPFEGSFAAQASARSTKVPWATFVLASLALVPMILPRAAAAFAYDRGAIAAGQFWRILACQWTHFSASHLLWDLATFTLLGIICELRDRASMLAVVGLAALLIPAAIWCFLPNLPSYRGLSGIDSALFILAAGNLARDASRSAHRPSLRPFALLLVVLFVIKLIVECITNKPVFTESGAFVPIPLAHLTGAIVGAAVTALSIRVTRCVQPATR